MRLNEPNTNIEFVIPPNQPLVSTTDLKGRILYCNDAFADASGFQREDLLGQPHNIIRHPDMPEEAFRDMWATIESGRPWSAPVKNRRADGSFYWVYANVTPLMGPDGPTSYMSVRTVAPPEVIKAAQALYADMRVDEKAGKLNRKFVGAELRRTDVISRLWRSLSLDLAGSVFLSIAIVAAAAFGLGVSVATQANPWLIVAAGVGSTGLLALIAGLYVKSLTIDPVARSLKQANLMAACDLTAQMPLGGSNLAARLTLALN
ncbi:MAG: PAS domain-containing protein [Burkholderiaceae bacterium]